MTLPQTSPKTDKELEEYLKSLKSDFKVFLTLIWRNLNLPDPTPVQLDIADRLQHGDQRMVIEAFRGVGKSWITSAFVVWLLFCDPQIKILVVSASKERADAFSTFTKRLINEIPLLHFLRAGKNQRDSNIAFDVAPSLPAHAPSVKSVGITGQMAGSRADVIIGDDVEIPNNSYTIVQREKLSETVKEFDAILTPKPTSRIIYLGTPQTEETLYEKLRERGYVVHIWPARFPKDALKYDGKLAKFIVERMTTDNIGDPTDPGRFDDADLFKRAASYGKSGFALQFMLDTSLSDAERYPLKLKDLIVMPIDSDIAPQKVLWTNQPEAIEKNLPSVGLAGDFFYRNLKIDNIEYKNYDRKILVVDPSGSGKDETGFAVLGLLNSQIFLIDFGGYLGGYEDHVLHGLSKIAQRHKIDTVVTEDNFGDGMMRKLLEPVMFKYHKCTIEGIKNTHRKEERIIDTLEPVMNQHKLIVNYDSISTRENRTVDKKGIEIPLEDKNYKLFYQLTRITKDKGSILHDDRLDALAIGVNYFVELMDNDVEQRIEYQQEQDIERELELWHINTIEVESYYDDNSKSNYKFF